MTLLPAEPIRITVPSQDRWTWEGLPDQCQVPDCAEPRESGGHHVVRRSHTGGPVDYVCIDGLVLPNRVALCTIHHGDVTDHRAWIVYRAEQGWLWYRTNKFVLRHKIEAGECIVHPKSGRQFYLVGPLKQVFYDPSTGKIEAR